MRSVPLIVAYCIIAFRVFGAGEINYPVKDIPTSLTEGVDVVVREDHTTFTITAKDRATLTAVYVVTILNDAGKRFARYAVGYDKLSKVTNFKGASYDGEGKLIKKLKTSEIYDQSAFDGFSLYSDNRFKHADLTHGTYPYTVEFTYEVEYKYLFIIPGSVVLPRERVSVQHFSYNLIFPTEIAPRYQAVNFHEAPAISKTGNTQSVSWKLNNVIPIKPEPHGPTVHELTPRFEAAPSQFEFEGYDGHMSSWDDLGRWILSLNKDRHVLPEATKAKVAEIASKYATTEEKVRAIYEFMQDKTRYVSIQLGIGGFQPFEASVVDQTGYGDCKALSNYTVALLEAVGIKANYTLIRAGEDAEKMDRQFPSSQFNHVVVSVPNGSDTLWLECTSQTNPFGYMGTFTGDRDALAITDDGAKIVHTPIYNEDENIQKRLAKITVEANGDANAQVTTTYGGLQYESDNLHFLLGDQKDKQEKWIRKNTSIPSFDIVSFVIENHKEKIPSAVVQLDLSLRRYATVSGKRIFLTPNLMNRRNYVPEKVAERKTRVIRPFGYTDIDIIQFEIPEGIYPEHLPEPVQIKSRFGEYEASIKLDEKGVVYNRRLKMFKGEFPPESYDELIDFLKNVTKADNLKLVFLNKT